MNEEEKLIKEQWEKLSPEIRGAIESVPWKSLVAEIAKNNSLDENRAAALERETMFVLYGFENPTDYLANIEKEVGLSEEQSALIGEGVADKIFEPIFQKIESAKPLEKTQLPMVEEGEKVHDVPHVETPKSPQSQPQPKVETPLPDYRYPDGADPYREPLK